MPNKPSLIVLLSFFLAWFVLSFPSSIFAATDPIAWWKFDDGSGTAPVDSSGNNITGSFLTPNPTWSTDVPSEISFSDPYSLDFTGTHDGVTFAWPSGLNFGATDPRSFSFWYKPVNDGENDAGGYDRIVSWDSDAFEIAGTTGGSTNHSISYYDGNWNGTSLTLTKGTWYHITFTYDGTTAKFYIGNDLKDSHSLGGRALSGTMAIGTRQNGHNEGINGRIDDFRVYNYPLSSTQIENLTSGSSNPDAPPATATPTPTSTPTATMTPTPSQTPTPTMVLNSSTVSNTSSSSTTTSTECSSSAPSSSPDLFQLSSALTKITLYFAPVSSAHSYVLSYGTTSDADQYATSFDYTPSGGAVSYTVSALAENQNYYFKVRAMNGCAPGSWSQTLNTKTTSHSSDSSLNVNPAPKPLRVQVLSQKEIDKNDKITEIDLPSTEITPFPTATSTPVQTLDGYSIDIKVTNGGKPVVGATVELHSSPRRAITDKAGIARFSQVEKGEHTVTIAFGEYAGEKKVEIEGDKKDIAINMSVEVRPHAWSSVFFGVGIELIIGVLIFLIILGRKKKKDNRK